LLRSTKIKSLEDAAMPARPSFVVQPLKDATFGAVVTNLRLAEVDEATFAELYQTWLEHALLIFPGQHLSGAEQIAFAKRFGALEFDLAPISNVGKDGAVHAEDADGLVKMLKGNMGWHCDSTYMPVQAKGAVFSAEVVPGRGGETGWADMRAAYDALAPEMQARIENLSAFHSLRYSQAKLGQTADEASDYTAYGFSVKDPPLRPLVKVHPETGRKTLAIGRHAFGVPGLEPAQSDELLETLCALACQPPRVHRHQWTPGDAVVWDNRCLMHRAYPWDMREPRVMHHSRIAGDPVSEFAPARAA
jgi:alpha-ketoglutarate-dependent taurine dioxygenase